MVYWNTTPWYGCTVFRLQLADSIATNLKTEEIAQLSSVYVNLAVSFFDRNTSNKIYMTIRQRKKLCDFPRRSSVRWIDSEIDELLGRAPMQRQCWTPVNINLRFWFSDLWFICVVFILLIQFVNNTFWDKLRQIWSRNVTLDLPYIECSGSSYFRLKLFVFALIFTFIYDHLMYYHSQTEAQDFLIIDAIVPGLANIDLKKKL